MHLKTQGMIQLRGPVRSVSFLSLPGPNSFLLQASGKKRVRGSTKAGKVKGKGPVTVDGVEGY